MRILALSEHFLPRIAGTAMTVQKTAAALARQGHEVTMLVPNPAFPDIDAEQEFAVKRIGPDLSTHGHPPRADRYAFCRAADAEIKRAIAAGEVDIVHVMFGLFLMEELDTRAYVEAGVPSVAMIHNMPPHECARTWDDSPLHQRLLDRARLLGVAAKNAARLKRHPYAAYLVPSAQVNGLVSKVLPDRRVVTVEHGVTDTILSLMDPPETRRPANGAKIRLLTVGGFTPHKRQHLVPDIVENLQARDIDVEWTLAGAQARNSPYFEALQQQVEKRGLQDAIRIRTSLSDADLAAAYDEANIYVQPSTEEGFCLTALDAAAAGLPVIGSPAGAIPSIVDASNGTLATSAVAPLADAIADFIRSDSWSDDTAERIAMVRKEWDWDRVARETEEVYRFALNGLPRSD